jgi:aminopeptidase N
MSYSEGFSFFDLEKENRDLNFPFAVIAHEVAHQWWGGLLRPAYVEGSALLTESLAWYSAMMAVEETYGHDHLERLLKVLRHEYLTPRSAADVPLLKATDRFNAYRKGPFAMYALKEYVGGDNVNLALKRLLHKFNPGQPPLPTSLDLYAELKTVTPDSLQYLLADLFERNTFWKLKAKKATVEKVGNQMWEVTFDFLASKVNIDEKGIETEFPMNDYIEVAIYGNSPDGDLGELLYLRKHQLSSGLQTLKIKVSKEPDLAGIDPNRLLIDQQIYDNFAPI